MDSMKYTEMLHSSQCYAMDGLYKHYFACDKLLNRAVSTNGVRTVIRINEL
jgi:hypothetical protein